MARLLTARQQQVFEFIQERLTQRGYGPTVREIGEFLGIKSPNGVMCHLKALERKGLISRTKNKSRSIELTDRNLRDGNVGLPVHGHVSGGECNLFKSPKSVDVISIFQRPERYLLQYTGHDLRDYAIADGDIMIVEHASTSRPGSLTLVKNSTGIIELKPDEALSDDAPHVIGVVVGIVRPHQSGLAIPRPHFSVHSAVS